MLISVILSIVIGMLTCVGMAVFVIVTSRRRAEATVPRCGNCGYNLTGAPSNRCPECGKLFIEAGVITLQPAASPSRRVILALVLLLIGFFVLGVLGTVWMEMRATAARAQAMARRQAALQARAAAQQARATASATEDRTASQPSETP